MNHCYDFKIVLVHTVLPGGGCGAQDITLNVDLRGDRKYVPFFRRETFLQQVHAIPFR